MDVVRRAADDACVPRDSVDALLASWRERRPDLDFSPVGVVARLDRVRAHVDAELQDVFETHGLGAANFSVLVTLARLGDGAAVSQRRLMDELGLTSGTISVRIDRLVEAGLVDRRPDPGSRRNTSISLTERGRAVFERVVPAHLANERRVLAALDDDEQALLAALLRKLLVEFEGACPSGDASASIGLAVTPAHVAMALRESVGLAPVAGLLVRAVDDGGPAAAAGVRPGDVLLAAGERELRSVAALYAAAEMGGGELPLRLLRVTEEREVRIVLPDAARLRGASAATGGRAARGVHRV